MINPCANESRAWLSKGMALPAEAFRTAPVRKLHVCLLEDYPVHEKMVTKILGYAGMDVTSAATGPVLDSLIRQGLQPDLFLIDLCLPGESGVSIMGRLRADPRMYWVPMVALTAFSTALDRKQCLAAGFDGFISKPIDLSNFTRTIRGYLQLREEWRR
jgi:CheY-like chemotaxis protein